MKKPQLQYRVDRDRWGFKISIDGNWRKLFAWRERDEAQKALDEVWAKASLPRTALVKAVSEYILESNPKRSGHRMKDLHWTFNRIIIPHWGENFDLRDLTIKHIEDFIQFHKTHPHERQYGEKIIKTAVRNITIWHYIKDLRAMLNWCIRKEWLKENPIDKADLTPIRNRKAVKPPLNIPAIDRGIEVLKGRERLYADTLRFMGLRKDEGNHVQASDVLDYGNEMWLRISYHQTDIKSNRVIPIPSMLHAAYRHYLATSQKDDYILCNNPRKKVYHRKRMFEKVSEAAGVRVTPKDLRDYFASVVGDPVIAGQMLGHTTLKTTAIYVRQVQSRMLEAMEELARANVPGGLVSKVEADLEAQKTQETSDKPAEQVIELIEDKPKWLN